MKLAARSFLSASKSRRGGVAKKVGIGCAVIFALVVGLALIGKKASEDKAAGRGGSSSAAAHTTGEAVQVGHFTYTVQRSYWSKHLSSNQFLDRKPDAMFLFVEIAVHNDDKEGRMVPPLKLIDPAGAQFDSDGGATMIDGALGVLDNINPGVTKKGFIVFDVPPGKDYALVADGGYGSSDSERITLQPEQR